MRSARKWLVRNNHRIQGYLWIGLGIPTLLWWKDSILWVALMSLYANAETSFGAHDAQRAKEESKDDE